MINIKNLNSLNSGNFNNLNRFNDFFKTRYLFNKVDNKIEKTETLFNEITKKGKSDNKDEKLKKVSQDFASLFINLMLKEMKKTLHKENNPLYGGLAEDIWSDLLYYEYSKLMAKNGLNSITQMVYEALKNK